MSDLSPALLDLMEHEKVIEQGLSTFQEVGDALLAIRDGKKFRAAGYHTFEAYIDGRWSDRMTVRHAQRILAFKRSTQVEGLRPAGHEPSTEGEFRRLRARDHPAPFSDPILAKIASHVNGADVILDPFAGTGRVHQLRERAGATRTIGIEIEQEWADKHPDTIHGDALALSEMIEPDSVDAIATSPTYGNRMADHHEARDASERLTYRHTLGHELADTNSGAMQWGDEYRALHLNVWRQSVAALRVGGTFTLNIKNHIRAGETQRVAEWHIDTLCRVLGLQLAMIDTIQTRGVGAGGDQHTGVEFVVTFRKLDA